MKILTLIIVMLTVSNVSHAQQGQSERKEFSGESYKHKISKHAKTKHPKFYRQILGKKYINEAEITKDQVSKLKQEFAVVEQQMREISSQILESARKQAQISVRVLTTPGDEGKDMIEMTEHIGQLRTNQAKLQVSLLMIIRDNLEPRQCAKVVELMKKERQLVHGRKKFKRNIKSDIEQKIID